MVSIDSYYPMAGLPNKLLSYQLFLRESSRRSVSIVFIQYIGPIVQAFNEDQNHAINA